MESFSLEKILASSAQRKHRNPTKIIVASFMAVILCGGLLLTLPISARDGVSVGFLGALFTATSATCVTGLVVFDTYTAFSTFGQVVIILLIQIGGLGLVTLTTFFNVMIGRRLGFKSMQLASESINISDTSQAKQLLKVVMTVALLFELFGAILLCNVFVPEYGADGIFISVFISISAFCNAGFDLFGQISPFTSLTTYASNPFVLSVVATLIASGGLGFLVWQDLAAFRRTRHLRLHTRIVLIATASLIVGGTIGIALLEWNNPATLGPMTVGDKIWNAMFQSVSARTAGFNSIDLASMSNVIKLFISLLMFIGAAPGGTGGGIKITTITVLIVAIVSVIRGRQEATISGHRIPQKTVYKTLAIFMLSMLVVIVSALTIFFNSGPEINEMDSVFEAVSAFATVGLSVGVTAIMNPIAQIITMCTMLVGRVGPVSMAISLSTHKDKNLSRNIVPQADISVG